MKIKFLLFLLLNILNLAWSSPTHDQANQILQKANMEYNKGNFTGALSLYKQVVETPLVHSTVYFNMGNCHFRLNQPGLALVAYKKAQYINPTSDDINANIEFVKSRLIDKYTLPEANSLTRILSHIHNFYPLPFGLITLCCLFSLSIFGLLPKFFLGHRFFHVSGYILSGLSLFLFLSFLPSVLIRVYTASKIQEAIIITTSTSLYSGPGKNYQLLTELHEGTSFSVLEESSGWSKVKLPNGQGGWVPSHHLGKVAL